MPVRFEPATGDARLCAVVVECGRQDRQGAHDSENHGELGSCPPTREFTYIISMAKSNHGERKLLSSVIVSRAGFLGLRMKFWSRREFEPAGTLCVILARL